jgi:hypothetical protein
MRARQPACAFCSNTILFDVNQILWLSSNRKLSNGQRGEAVSTPASPLEKMGAGPMGIIGRDHPMGLD